MNLRNLPSPQRETAQNRQSFDAYFNFSHIRIAMTSISRPLPSVQVLVDNPSSWILEPAQTFVAELKVDGYEAELVGSHQDLKRGDILILLGCEKIVDQSILSLHTYNLVVHESALPLGKGMSPLTWQVLAGESVIPVTLFEAVEELDAGPIYGQTFLQFGGHELVNELRSKQTEATFSLLRGFLASYPEVKGKQQEGKESIYPRRKPHDSELDPKKTLAEQFNLLRVVDNDRYPAFFYHLGHKYVLKIQKADDSPNFKKGL